MKIKVGQIWFGINGLLLIVGVNGQTVPCCKIIHVRVDDLTVRWTTDFSVKCGIYIGEI